jgi:putative phage-type endonuclease
VNAPIANVDRSLIAQIVAADLEEFQSESDWIEGRKMGLGASESAILFGQGYAGSSSFKLYSEKLGLIPKDDFEAKFLRIGKLMEPVLRRLFTDETGFPCYEVGENHTFRSKQHPFMTASLDGLIVDDGGLGVIELKNIHFFNRDEWSEDAGPLKYQIQLQHQLAVTGLEFGYLFGLVGGQEPYAHRINRNDEFISKALVPMCEKFFKLMQSQTPPEIDGSEATARALTLLHPDDDGTEVALDDRFLDLDQRLQEIKVSEKAMEAERTIVENEFRAAIGSSTFGVLPGGVKYSLKTTSKDGYYVKPQKYRSLRRKAAR